MLGFPKIWPTEFYPIPKTSVTGESTPKGPDTRKRA